MEIKNYLLSEIYIYTLSLTVNVIDWKWDKMTCGVLLPRENEISFCFSSQVLVSLHSTVILLPQFSDAFSKDTKQYVLLPTLELFYDRWTSKEFLIFLIIFWNCSVLMETERGRVSISVDSLNCPRHFLFCFSHPVLKLMTWFNTFP